ncbi:MAG TPA: clostripain-related cysteine peptidase [Anaerolineales bacterium]|nr:clostripain-related cysteine peptidase [Anaerolineales bacterium]
MHETKEWTLMFYFASDNPLAPGVVSQLKAIKAAGYHPDANVVTQFDPYVEGTPTHIFEVNLMNKLRHPGVADVGFPGNDPFIRNLVEDKLWREQRTRDNKAVKSELRRVLKQNHQLEYDAPTPPQERFDVRSTPRDDPDEPDPQQSLRSFLDFCRTRYPARHFALFILGHGVVVGNDVFLYDEHASEHSITLKDLGDILRDFKTDIDQAEFELVSFHSCSVSSMEVAFELKGTANYMLASQGPAFVGTWPYRSILIRIFNDLIREGSHINIRRMFYRMFQLCFFNAVDFLLAGYSFQLTLINLQRVSCIENDFAVLIQALLAGLSDEPKYVNPATGEEEPTHENQVTQDVIQLAHLKSQSFFQEMYTDVYDFCFCITQKVEEMKKRVCHCVDPHGPCHCIPKTLQELADACDNVMKHLIKENPGNPKGQYHERIIVAAEFLGPSYQYSRGLSVYFPWTRPIGDRRILSEYANYKFHKDFEPERRPGTPDADREEETVAFAQNKRRPKRSWLTFLNTYFDTTLRTPSSEECDPRRVPPGQCPNMPDPPCPHDPKCPKHKRLPEPNPCEPQAVRQPPPEPTPCEKEQEERDLKEDIANLIYGDQPAFGAFELAGKTDPKDRTGGDDGECPSIKNYPRDTRPRRKRAETAPRKKEVRVEFTQAEFLIE